MGGGGADSARTTLNVHNFLISKLKPPNLVTFPEIYLGTISYSKSLSIKFGVTMATTF